MPSNDDSISEFFNAICDAGLDQLMAHVKAGNFQRRQASLCAYGVSATVISALEPLLHEMLKMDELLKTGDSSENSGKQRTIGFANLLADLDPPEIESAYQDRGLSEEMVEHLTAKARQDIEAIRTKAKLTRELHFDQALHKIANLCRSKTPDLLPDFSLADYWNRMAGMLPELARRVQSCWNAALKKANEQLVLNNVPLYGLSAFLDKELGIFFAREYLSTTGHEGFHEMRGTPAAIEAVQHLVIQQSASLASYCRKILEQSQSAQAAPEKLMVDMA